jgi:photosystem I subunit 2
LRTLFKITDYKIYRIFPNSEVQYLHPKDGVFPEKLNEGRVGVGNIGHSIGKNPQPVNLNSQEKIHSTVNIISNSYKSVKLKTF